MDDISWWAICVFCADWLIRIGLSVRVIMRRLPVGVSLAWLFVVVTFPFGGALAYLMIGEMRLGHFRERRATQLRRPFHAWMAEIKAAGTIDWTQHPGAEPVARLCETTLHIPPMVGNRLKLLSDYESALGSLIKDIDTAKETCHLEFYIWNAGGLADQVADALLRAVRRGVVCRVLLDDVGSRPFLRSEQAQRLRDGGVALCAALPAKLWRVLFVRFDLRLHRKIAVIDGRIAYTGSLNLADPRYFKQEAGVGEWVDAMVRVEGPAVEPLAITFLSDWAIERQENLDAFRATETVRRIEPVGSAPLQVIPSGPSHDAGAIEKLLVATIYSAQHRLVLTTPYFVPDEALLQALISAAQRGVAVTLIIPARIDSRLARLASQAFQGDLIAAGVRVLLFEGGLLHTKSVTVDGAYSLFGSLNLDPRSLHLNFEITLAVYDAEFTQTLETLQQRYAARSRPMQLSEWQSRTRGQKFVENSARLMGPLL